MEAAEPLEVCEGWRNSSAFGENPCLHLGAALAPSLSGETNPLRFHLSLATVQGKLKEKAGGRKETGEEEGGKARDVTQLKPPCTVTQGLDSGVPWTSKDKGWHGEVRLIFQFLWGPGKAKALRAPRRDVWSHASVLLMELIAPKGGMAP